MLRKVKGLNFWRVFLISVVFAGAVAYIGDRLRGYPQQLDEEFPWDISATLNIFCGLSLAAGGFTISAVLAALDLANCQLLRRSSSLIAYLGFLSALATSMLRYRLGWKNVWTLWSPHSIPAGATVAFLLYSAVLFDELLSSARTPNGYKYLRLPSVRYISMLLTCIAAFLAGLQESAFLYVMAVAPARFSPIWASSMLPVNVFLSGVSACLALTIIALWSFGRSNQAWALAATSATKTRISVK